MPRIRLAVCIVSVSVLLAGCTVGTPAPGSKASPASSPGATTGAPVQGNVSEGVAFMGADKWQAAGITGKGVKVGVIDGAFTRYKDFLGNAKVTTKSFRSDGLIEDRAIHGTACAEIVHETAPDAELYLVTQETPAEFATAIRWLVNTAGVSVISSSIGYDLVAPLDGTGIMAQEIDKAKAAGVFFINAAGNEASGKIGARTGSAHFTATFSDKDGDGFHDFPGAQTKNALRMAIGEGSFEVKLNWDDWKQPHVNYDLFVVDTNGREVGRSANDQSRGNKEPYEQFDGKVSAGTYLLKVKKVNPRDPDLAFNIWVYNAQLEQTTPAGSLSTPADAKGAVTVAAIDVQTGKVEDFSSQGGTLDGRKKPDIGGPDNTRSFAYASTGEKTFPGTSAATPHVAGAAALYKQAFPDASPDMVFKYFADHAKPIQGAAKGENISGAGVLFLDTPPANAATGPAPTRPAATVPVSTAPGISPTTVAPTALSTVAANPTAGRPAATTAASPASTRSAPATSTGSNAFTDNFSSPSSGLPAAGYQNGEYHLRVNAATTASLIYPPVASGAATESYSVQVRKANGADDAVMGLVVRYQDANNYLFFVITNDGSYGLLAKVNGSITPVGSGTSGTSAAIKRGGTNLLHVTVSGTRFAFAINGQTVIQSVNITNVRTQGRFGLVGGGGSKAPVEAAFTDFRVTVT